MNVGNISLENRIAMAPMTRSRTSSGDVPNALMAEYYGQRAAAGLLISEGTPISPVGRGYSMTPGIYSPEQLAGWKLVTDAVHAKDGKIFAQLWHVGRRSHSSIAGEQPLSASAVKDPDQVFGPLAEGGFGMVETQAPRAMTATDIAQTIADFVQAAKNAVAAGFDGVEVHGAHGYLLEQFMQKRVNQRDDCYGGSSDNRIRFTVEIMQGICAAIGSDKVAIRLSPFISEGIASGESDLPETVLKLVAKLAPMDLAFIHFSENIANFTAMPDSYRQQIRDIYPNPIMVAGKYTPEKGEAIINAGYADLVAFGQPFIVNPDFTYRVKHGISLAEVGYDAHSTFYGGGAVGYTDYPTAVSAD
ncbi:alkene reductase [Ferrimonas lipolytica]|uniref:Alkene reductase n=1 Tax=Ferrimonas lipolytica TaxID=2724191 RepID=A0A6H1UK26_9GAMM|nr:alkene reductase [Ferrimonas lipolytica]QIZ78960.1 alkene reductase [Ferrimonas lipolytica]